MRRLVACCLLLLLAACLKPAGIRYPHLPTIFQGALHIVNFDIGQGDALLVLYNQKSILIDAGAAATDPITTNRVVPRRLDSLLGSRHIDYMVLTHYHRDHLGGPGNQPNRKDPVGVFALIEREGFTVGTMVDRGFWTVGERGNTQKHYERSIKRWLAEGLVEKRRVVRPGDKLDMGGDLVVEVICAAGNGLLGRLQTLFPTFIETAAPSENDYSIGLKLTLGDFEMFTAGDLSGRNVLREHGEHRQSYNDIETRIAKTIGPVEVYRVNHHGSRHSTNPCFAQSLHPMVSIFSTGHNKYGHPDPDVWARLKQYGDPWITGGVDPKRKDLIQPHELVRDDVEVLVAPDGATFWVNGKKYDSLSDSEEMARPLGGESLCPDADGDETTIDPGGYEVEHLDGWSGD